MNFQYQPGPIAAMALNQLQQYLQGSATAYPDLYLELNDAARGLGAHSAGVWQADQLQAVVGWVSQGIVQNGCAYLAPVLTRTVRG